MNELHICQMEVEKTMLRNYCTEDFSKNMNNDLVFFRDEIKIFLISWFETRSRFVSSTSRALRRDREFVPSNLEFRDGDEILKKISCGRARYLVAKSHEIFRDRDISPCSGVGQVICRGGGGGTSGEHKSFSRATSAPLLRVANNQCQ